MENDLLLIINNATENLKQSINELNKVFKKEFSLILYKDTEIEGNCFFNSIELSFDNNKFFNENSSIVITENIYSHDLLEKIKNIVDNSQVNNINDNHCLDIINIILNNIQIMKDKCNTLFSDNDYFHITGMEISMYLSNPETGKRNKVKY